MDDTQHTPATTEAAPVAASAAPAAKIPKQAMWYVLTFLVVLVIGLGLWFVLERDGRVSTGVFSGVTSFIKAGKPAATVNGVEISVADFESTLRQITANTAAQGVDVNDPTIATDLRAQALESLVNTEVLRQKAVEANVEVSDDEVAARYAEIETGLGGPENLKARMEELGVTDEMLRRDIKNDILIQAHLTTAIATSSIEVTEEEITSLYAQASAGSADVPPLEEVRPQVEQQVRFQKEQSLVAAYVADLRAKAEVEILI